MKKKSPITHFRLGQMYMIKKDYFRARQEFKITVKLAPDMTEAYKKLGESCMVLGDFNEAETYYEKAYKSDSEDNELAMSLAICYDNNDKVEEAIEVLKKIRENKKDYPMVNYNLAYGYKTLDNIEEARKYLEEELKFFPDNEMALELKKEIS
ncbi:MAG: tetratricopeptide repeat protein [Candidatus Muiribacteriota bacterium]